jgi:MFS family permease
MVAIIFPMHTPYRHHAEGSKASAFLSLMEGIQYLWSNKTIFSLVILSFIPALFIMPVMQILPSFTENVLHARAHIYGYLMAAFGVGGLLATLTMASIGGAIRSGKLGIMALFGASFFIILFSFSDLPWIAFLLLAAVGFFTMTFRVNNNTLVQTLVPDALRGRIMSLYQLDHALLPVSYALMGVCADIFSTPRAIAAVGLIGLLFVAVLMAGVKQMRDIRNLRV